MASSSIKSFLLALFLFLMAPTMASTSGSTTPPSPVKCIHHHARLTSCAHYLEDDVHVPQPTKACCQNYNEIFRSGTPTCLCRYLHPENLKTSFIVSKLMSLHDLCQSSTSTTVPLYDLCVGPEQKFDGIIEVVNRDQVNLRRKHPSRQA